MLSIEYKPSGQGAEVKASNSRSVVIPHERHLAQDLVKFQGRRYSPDARRMKCADIFCACLFAPKCFNFGIFLLYGRKIFNSPKTLLCPPGE